MKSTPRVLGAAACVVVMLGLVGCQAIVENATEKAVEEATGVKVDKDGENVTITGEDGTQISTSEDGELPDGFPADVPVYDGSIVGSIKSGEGFMVSIQTTDDLQTVYDWYLDKAGADGWSKTSETKMSEGGIVAAEKGGSVFHATLAASESGGTDIGLSVGPKD